MGENDIRYGAITAAIHPSSKGFRYKYSSSVMLEVLGTLLSGCKESHRKPDSPRLKRTCEGAKTRMRE